MRSRNRVRRIIFFLMVLSVLISVIVYAHPGRTDGSGGHTNHSTGEYHYHHGHSEHQHYDMDGDGIADCPYEIKDNTSHKDSSSGSSGSYWKDRYNSLMQEEEEKGNNHTTSTNDNKSKNRSIAKNIIAFMLVAMIVFPPVIVVPISYIYSKVRDLIQKLKKK